MRCHRAYTRHTPRSTMMKESQLGPRTRKLLFRLSVFHRRLYLITGMFFDMYGSLLSLVHIVGQRRMCSL